MNDNSSVDTQPHPLPWWRVRMMWLVLGGPLAVVVAGVVTTVIAVRGADPVLPTRPPATASAAQPSGGEGGPATALRPAVEGRNHAATPAAGAR